MSVLTSQLVLVPVLALVIGGLFLLVLTDLENVIRRHRGDDQADDDGYLS